MRLIIILLYLLVSYPITSGAEPSIVAERATQSALDRTSPLTKPSSSVQTNAVNAASRKTTPIQSATATEVTKETQSTRSNQQIQSPNHAPKKALAIVIDDFGNNMKGTEEMLSLPVPLTTAIMPFLSTTEKDAHMAYEKGHEVIIHLPMEPKKGKKSWLGPGAITTDLNDKEIRERVEKAIEAVPHAVGMNHHMGSKATEDERVMRIVLEVCKEKGLYYLDSKTTSNSVIEKLAKELSVPYLENNLFFDHIYTAQHINKQAYTLMHQLDENEHLIAIGHVGITGQKVVEVLKAYIPFYEKQAEIVPLSSLIPGSEMIDKILP